MLPVHLTHMDPNPNATRTPTPMLPVYLTHMDPNPNATSRTLTLAINLTLAKLHDTRCECYESWVLRIRLSLAASMSLHSLTT